MNSRELRNLLARRRNGTLRRSILRVKVRAVPTKKQRRVGIRERVRVREVRAIGRGMMRIVIGRRRRDWEVEKMEGERAREVGLETTCLVCILCCLLLLAEFCVVFIV